MALDGDIAAQMFIAGALDLTHPARRQVNAEGPLREVQAAEDARAVSVTLPRLPILHVLRLTDASDAEPASY